MDGIDAAIIRTDGETVSGFGPARTFPYDDDLREAIRAALGNPDPGADLVRRLTDRHADAIRHLLARPEGPDGRVSVVGMHGHTIHHAPDEGVTVQAGDGPRLARATGLDVVHDFRSADVAAGGQGAPLAPLYHKALCQGLDGPIAVLNLGGIANVTWIGSGAGDDPIAFDTGPGNALLDDWIAATTEQPFDRDGAVSDGGVADPEIVADLLGNEFFRRPPPKSLDRLDLDIGGVAGLAPGDGAATLARLTCEAVALAAAHLPAPPARWLVTGGGRRNPTLMRGLADCLQQPVAPVEDAGWDGDALEAQAFAFLAVRVLRGLPLSLPSTTGVPAPQAGGAVARAPRNRPGGGFSA